MSSLAGTSAIAGSEPAAEAVAPTVEIMIPSGMGEDSWYLVHDFSPSNLMKAFRRRGAGVRPDHYNPIRIVGPHLGHERLHFCPNLLRE